MTDPQVDANGVLEVAVKVDGYRITIHPPSAGSDYHAIYYYDADGRQRNTTGGRTFQKALDKLPQIVERIDAGSDNIAKTLNQLLDAWEDPGRARPKPWSIKYAYNTNGLLKRYARPAIGHRTCRDLTKEIIQQGADAAPTEGEGRATLKTLKAALRWADGEGYLTTSPRRLLSGVFWKPPHIPVVDPNADPSNAASTQGADQLWVDPKDIPSPDSVADLAYEMTTFRTSEDWWSLLVWVAAYSGVRIGELIALRASDVDLTNRVIAVERQRINAGAEYALTLPKGGKKRGTKYPVHSPPSKRYPNGFEIANLLEDRVLQVRQKDPDGLLFCTPSGKYWRFSNFYRARFHPAAKKAHWQTHKIVKRQDGAVVLDANGIPVLKDKLDMTWHTLRHVFCTDLLWRRGVTPQDVADLAGHSSVDTTLRTYSSRSSGALARVHEATK